MAGCETQRIEESRLQHFDSSTDSETLTAAVVMAVAVMILITAAS